MFTAGFFLRNPLILSDLPVTVRLNRSLPGTVDRNRYN